MMNERFCTEARLNAPRPLFQKRSMHNVSGLLLRSSFTDFIQSLSGNFLFANLLRSLKVISEFVSWFVELRVCTQMLIKCLQTGLKFRNKLLNLETNLRTSSSEKLAENCDNRSLGSLW